MDENAATNGHVLTREEILASEDLNHERVFIPEWGESGGYVFVWELMGDERDDFEQSLVDTSGPGGKFNMRGARARLAVKCCRDAEGNRLFQDNDATALGRKSGNMLDLICGPAMKLNRLQPQDIEEMAKNSATALNGASTPD